jgi:TatA/E family protein of Tat protein translocase
MFGSIGGPELLLIFVVALLIFGPRKLPELGKSLGKGLAEFRRAASDLRDSLETEVARESKPAPQGAPALPAGGQAPPGTLEAAPVEAPPVEAASVPAAPAAENAGEPRNA